MNEDNGNGAATPTDNGGLVGIAKNAKNAVPGTAPRGRGRPPGSGSASPKPAAAVLPLVPQVVWTPQNVGAVVRLPYALTAWTMDIPNIALDAQEQEIIIPAAVEVFNQFAPLAAAKWASLITLTAALMTVSASKIKLYRDTQKEKAKTAAEKEAGK